jgi:GNAT superfamily N-acetyltransferase
MNSAHIKIASTSQDISRCYPVMAQLRPQYTEEQFVMQAQRQQNESGYVLAYIEDAATRQVKAVAGFRIAEYLAWGKTLYLDDLVSDEADRGKGYAWQLFDWLVANAKDRNCDQVHLDSGVGANRYRAHRFYLMKGMNITSHHFVLKLK